MDFLNKSLLKIIHNSTFLKICLANFFTLSYTLKENKRLHCMILVSYTINQVSIIYVSSFTETVNNEQSKNINETDYEIKGLELFTNCFYTNIYWLFPFILPM